MSHNVRHVIIHIFREPILRAVCVLPTVFYPGACVVGELLACVGPLDSPVSRRSASRTPGRYPHRTTTMGVYSCYSTMGVHWVRLSSALSLFSSPTCLCFLVSLCLGLSRMLDLPNPNPNSKFISLSYRLFVHIPC